jgi:hypothetical protein
MKDALYLPIIKIHELSNVNKIKENVKETKINSSETDVELSNYLNAVGAIIRLR